MGFSWRYSKFKIKRSILEAKKYIKLYQTILLINISYLRLQSVLTLAPQTHQNLMI